MFIPSQHSDFKSLIWICGIIASVGGAGAVFLGISRWMTAVFTRIGSLIAHVDSIPVIAAAQTNAAQIVAATKEQVDSLASNHLRHQSDQGEEQIKLLTNIDKGISILVDRGRPA